jgi:hypothetical protein
VKRSRANPPESLFMQKYIPVFLHRYILDYYREGPCSEYFVSKRVSGGIISSSIILSYNPLRNDLHVSRFHPELYLEKDSRYMSAVCFYLTIQHCIQSYSLNDTCHISLETVPAISDDFYKKLGDFNFHVNRPGLGNVVELESDIVVYPVDTSMIADHVFVSDEIPFVK